MVDHVARVYHTISSDNNIGNEAISQNLKKCGKPQSLCHITYTPAVETKLVSTKIVQISVPKSTNM